MATFLVSECPLRRELKMCEEATVDDYVKLASSSSADELPLFLLMNGANLKERKDERPPPSKEYLERIEKLKAREEERRWAEERKAVMAGDKNLPSFGVEMRAANRQMTVIINMILTVIATFAFGFIGLQYTHPGLSQETRLFIGLIMATVVFFADMYFVIKSLDM